MPRQFVNSSALMCIDLYPNESKQLLVSVVKHDVLKKKKHDIRPFYFFSIRLVILVVNPYCYVIVQPRGNSKQKSTLCKSDCYKS